MDNEFSKKYYKIKEVSDIIGISQSTIRFWESEFPEIKPKRGATNRRLYEPKDIRTLRIIYYLLKEKGLKIEAAKEQLKINKDNISKKIEILDKLVEIKEDLLKISSALRKRK